MAADLRPRRGRRLRTTRSIEIDLDTLKPLINGPHSPDRAHEASRRCRRRRRRRAENGWPLEVSAALIGSCTNSSYEDITRAASIARQAKLPPA